MLPSAGHMSHAEFQNARKVRSKDKLEQCPAPHLKSHVLSPQQEGPHPTLRGSGGYSSEDLKGLFLLLIIDYNRVYVGVILGYIGIMENKMETTILL